MPKQKKTRSKSKSKTKLEKVAEQVRKAEVKTRQIIRDRARSVSDTKKAALAQIPIANRMGMSVKPISNQPDDGLINSLLSAFTRSSLNEITVMAPTKDAVAKYLRDYKYSMAAPHMKIPVGIPDRSAQRSFKVHVTAKGVMKTNGTSSFSGYITVSPHWLISSDGFNPTGANQGHAIYYSNGTGNTAVSTVTSYVPGAANSLFGVPPTGTTVTGLDSNSPFNTATFPTTLAPNGLSSLSGTKDSAYRLVSCGLQVRSTASTTLNTTGVASMFHHPYHDSSNGLGQSDFLSFDDNVIEAPGTYGTVFSTKYVPIHMEEYNFHRSLDWTMKPANDVQTVTAGAAAAPYFSPATPWAGSDFMTFFIDGQGSAQSYPFVVYANFECIGPNFSAMDSDAFCDESFLDHIVNYRAALCKPQVISPGLSF